MWDEPAEPGWWLALPGLPLPAGMGPQGTHPLSPSPAFQGCSRVQISVRLQKIPYNPIMELG